MTVSLKFLFGSVLNTALSYTAYLLLILALPYQAAYFLAYVLGIVFAYTYNAKVVFLVSPSVKGMLAYPLVYAVQYILSALILNGLVERFAIAREVAPLILSVLILPITFLLNKIFLQGLPRKVDASKFPESQKHS